MRNRNRNRTKLTPKPLQASREYDSRQLVRKHGSLERVHSKLHASAFEYDRKHKIGKMITIPAFHGWYFTEFEDGFLIVPPKGSIASHKVCDDPKFRGQDISKLPEDTQVSSVAKSLIKFIAAASRESHGDEHKAIVVTTSDYHASSSQTVIIVAKAISDKASLLSKQNHKLALAWCERFRFHLGVNDTIQQEKIIGRIPDKGYQLLVR